MTSYDVTIVGAGISGLVSANFLAKYGKKVLLLEQNHHAGGNMSGFSRKGYYFDGGDQSFESLGLVFPILQELGVYDMQDWLKVRYRMMSKDFDFFVDSIDEVEASLIESFPQEISGIKSMFDEIRQVSKFLSQNYTPESFPLINDFSFGKMLSNAKWLPKVLRWLKFSYREKACSVIKDPGLRNWFTHIGYYKMPYLFFSGFWHIWAYDYWYPVGGMQAFLDRLTKAFTDRGGEVKFNSSVERVLINNGKAYGVKTDDGEEYHSKKVIYAGDYKRFVGSIVPESYFKPKFVRNIKKSGLTEALVSVYLGVNYTPEELEKQLKGGHHVFYFPNYEALFPDRQSPEEIHKDMWTVINFFGPENASSAPKGKSSIVLQTYSSHDWQQYWKNGSESLKRSDEYNAFKKKVAYELIETGKNILPDLADKIDYMDVGTPLSLIRFSRNTAGSTGGWCYHDKVSPVYRNRKLNMFHTPVENLYASGHYALWPGGVISAALSGRLVANLAAGRKILTPLSK